MQTVHNSSTSNSDDEANAGTETGTNVGSNDGLDLMPVTEPNTGHKAWKNNGTQIMPMIKPAFKLILLAVLFLMVLVTLEALLQNSDSVSIRRRAILDVPPNSTDILIVGNSHAYCTFNPAVMEEITGKRVLNAGLPDAKIDITYFALKDLLARQTPDTIILETFVFGSSKAPYSGFLANVDAMDFGFDKIRACFEIYPDKLQSLRMCTRLYRCHNNWKEPKIVKDNVKDLLGMGVGTKLFGDGFYRLDTRMTAETIDKYKNATTSEYSPVIDNASIKYFRRIADLCDRKGIRLVVAAAPMNDLYLEKINYPAIYEKMALLCNEQGLEYVDYNRLYHEVGLLHEDFEDAFSNAQHLNVWGADKVSLHMAKKLAAGYSDISINTEQ